MKQQILLREPDFTVENIEIVKVSRRKYYRHSNRNGRLQNGFLFTVSGSVEMKFLKGETFLIPEETLVFLPCGTSYIATYMEHQTELNIVQFDLAKGALPDYLSQPKIIPLPDAKERIAAFFKTSEGHFRAGSLYYAAQLYSLLYAIEERETEISSKFRRLEPALTEISQNYHQNKKVAYYAALCDMSEVNFRRCFREYTGKTPIEYRNEVRLKHARGFLQSGEYNVSETAEACGFSNLSFFIRRYKKIYGRTPKQG